MTNFKELREKQAKLVTDARSKYDAITDNTDEARAGEIEREYDAIMAEHDKIEGLIIRGKKQAEIEARLQEGDARRPQAVDGEARAQDEGAKVDYREAFRQYLYAGGQLGDMDAEARAVLKSGFEGRVQSSGTTTEGGYTVPTTMHSEIVRSMLAWGPMYDENICTTINTTGGGQITIPTINDTAKVVVKHVEGTALTNDGGSDAVFGQKVLDAYPFNTEFLNVSLELLNDSVFSVETLIGSLLGERLGRRANSELTVGDGTGDPNGVVTASAAGKVAASTTAITWDEIMDLEHSVDPAYRVGPKVRYMFNDSTLAAVRKLKDGNGNYLWQMGDVKSGIPGTFNGRNYSINQAILGLGDGASTKVMIFGDFGKYIVRKVGGIQVGAVNDSVFWPGRGLAGYIRFDGELSDTAAVKHLALAAS
jgi:HK97 family phage major capsid protein